MDLNTADKMVHSVETQWHHPIMVRYGFAPETKEAVGFVRAYVYKHPDGRRIRCATGYSSDHWQDLETKKTGYWADLEPHLRSLTQTEVAGG